MVLIARAMLWLTEDRAQASNITDAHQTFGPHDNLLLEIDADA